MLVPRCGAIHSAPTHTAAPSGAKRVRRCSGQRSTPTGRGEAPGRACSQLFFRGCVAAPRAARPRQGRHMQSPLLHTLLILCSSTTSRLGRRQHPARDLHLPPLPPCRHGRALHRAAEGGVVRGGVPSLRPHRVQLALGGGGHPVGPRPAGMCTARKIRKLTLLRGSWVWVGSRKSSFVCGGESGGSAKSHSPMWLLAMSLWLTHTHICGLHIYGRRKTSSTDSSSSASSHGASTR